MRRRRLPAHDGRDFIAAVVEHAGREVAAFPSDNHTDPDIAAEALILKSRSDGGDMSQNGATPS
jgi:hypothetical protein